MAKKRPISILIAVDSDIVREGLQAIINGQPTMAAVGEASHSQAVKTFHQLRPNITIISLSKLLDGLETIAEIRKGFPQSRIIALIDNGPEEAVYRALQAGAQSILLKSMSAEQILEVVHAAHKGQRYIPPIAASCLAERLAGSTLTERELEVLGLVAVGRSNKRIANALYIAEGTVKVHLKNILSKLVVSDRTEAVTTALRRGMIHLDQAAHHIQKYL